MSRELTNVKVSKISLVNKAANGEEVTIFKSAQQPETTETPAEETPVEETAPVETVVEKAAEPTEDAKFLSKFVSVMKNMFGGQETVVSKAADIDTKTDYTSFLSRLNNPKNKVQDALWLLDSTLWEIFWDDSVENGKELILKNIDDFKTYVESVLNGPIEVQKAAFTKVEKAEEEQEMNAEELKAVLEPIQKSIGDLTEKITAMETKTQEEVAKSAETETKVAETETKVAEVATEVAKAADNDTQITALLTDIKKSVDGLGERVTSIESFRGLSNGQEATKVEKAEGDIWAGVLEI